MGYRHESPSATFGGRAGGLWIAAPGFSVAELRRPSPDCHLAVFGVPADERRLVDVQREDRGGIGRSRCPPAFPAAVADLLVGLGGAAVELQFSLAAVGVGDRAVQHTTRIPQEVASLQ